MLCGGTSKLFATTLAYPHGALQVVSVVNLKVLVIEVIRTRLREEGTKYKNFRQTLMLVLHEEGARSMYKYDI